MASAVQQHPRVRVVSLLPSATEILYLLGADVVGRSHECDWPEAIHDTVPALTGAHNKFETSPQMHEAVSASLQSGRGLYWLDSERLASLRPDAIVTQSLCSVCAVDIDIVRTAAAAIFPPPRIIDTNPMSLHGVIADVRRLGADLGLVANGEKAAAALQSRVDRAVGTAAELAAEAAVTASAAAARPKRVVFIEWTSPIFPGGHWTPQMIHLAGGVCPINPPKDGGGALPSRETDPSEVVAADPDLVIVAPCGLDLETTRREVELLGSERWWRGLRAVQSGAVVLVDGNQHFNRPGPRLVDALEWLVGLLWNRPDLMPPGFPWERLPALPPLDAEAKAGVEVEVQANAEAEAEADAGRRQGPGPEGGAGAPAAEARPTREEEKAAEVQLRGPASVVQYAVCSSLPPAAGSPRGPGSVGAQTASTPASSYHSRTSSPDIIQRPAAIVSWGQEGDVYGRTVDGGVCVRQVYREGHGVGSGADAATPRRPEVMASAAVIASCENRVEILDAVAAVAAAAVGRVRNLVSERNVERSVGKSPRLDGSGDHSGINYGCGVVGAAVNCKSLDAGARGGSGGGGDAGGGVCGRGGWDAGPTIAASDPWVPACGPWSSGPHLPPDIEELHAAACEAGKSSYTDPDTGYMVFTQVALAKRGSCCANRCRHCPWGHFRVVRRSRLNRITRPVLLHPTPAAQQAHKQWLRQVQQQQRHQAQRTKLQDGGEKPSQYRQDKQQRQGVEVEVDDMVAKEEGEEEEEGLVLVWHDGCASSDAAVERAVTGGPGRRRSPWRQVILVAALDANTGDLCGPGGCASRGPGSETATPEFRSSDLSTVMDTSLKLNVDLVVVPLQVQGRSWPYDNTAVRQALSYVVRTAAELAQASRVAQVVAARPPPEGGAPDLSIRRTADIMPGGLDEIVRQVNAELRAC